MDIDMDTVREHAKAVAAFCGTLAAGVASAAAAGLSLPVWVLGALILVGAVATGVATFGVSNKRQPAKVAVQVRNDRHGKR